MTFTPKYHLTGESRWLSNGVRLSRLIAARSFGSVKKGDRGGWVESPENLSHEGTCWIAGDAAALKMIDSAIQREMVAAGIGEVHIRETDRGRIHEDGVRRDEIGDTCPRQPEGRILRFGTEQDIG